MDRGKWRKWEGMTEDHDWCKWLNVSSRAGSPGLSRTKYREL